MIICYIRENKKDNKPMGVDMVDEGVQRVKLIIIIIFVLIIYFLKQLQIYFSTKILNKY